MIFILFTALLAFLFSQREFKGNAKFLLQKFSKNKTKIVNIPIWTTELDEQARSVMKENIIEGFREEYYQKNGVQIIMTLNPEGENLTRDLRKVIGTKEQPVLSHVLPHMVYPLRENLVILDNLIENISSNAKKECLEEYEKDYEELASIFCVNEISPFDEGHQCLNLGPNGNDLKNIKIHALSIKKWRF